MNIKKIYTDFEAARKATDLERIGDIIAQVGGHYQSRFQTENTVEIPPKAIHIMRHTDLLVYCAMKFLNEGKTDKALTYLLALNKINSQFFLAFFSLRYLLGKALYMTGDYFNALSLFVRYEEARAEQWNDIDELSLFYRANCLAMLGDFNAAVQIYDQLLKIKADFPEVKHNLELARRSTNENLARELESLWNFCDWQDVPIFINARDRLGIMKKLLDWLLEAGYRNLIILDNKSTYPPLLEYYRALESDSRLKVIRLKENFGYKALWLSNVLEQLKISTPYVYTDPDVLPIERCPKDFVGRLMEILDSNHELRKVGLGLVWKDITFFDKKAVQKIESGLYEGSQIGKNLHYAQVDTTFALYSNVRHYNLRFSLRTTGDLRAYHLPWYFDYDNLPEDERYYLEHADKNSVTTVKKFLEE